MILERYGIRLKRLTEENLELVRQKRNKLRHLMEYREYITPEMQKKWFCSINNLQNFYYIIIYKNEKVGLISQKEVSKEQNSMNSGLFLFDPKYYESPVPVCASLLLIENGFYLLKTGTSRIQILHTNAQAIKYNRSLGYELCSGQESVKNQWYEMSKQSFESKTAKLRKAALQLSGGDNSLKLILEKEDFENGIAALYENYIREWNLPVKKIEDRERRIYMYRFED